MVNASRISWYFIVRVQMARCVCFQFVKSSSPRSKKEKKKKKEANGPDYFASSSFIYSFLSVVSPDFIFLFYSLSAFYVGCNRNFLSFPWSRPPPPIFFFIIISANIFFVSLLVNKMTKLKTWKGINFF